MFYLLVQKYAESDVRVDVVFGFKELIDKYLGGDEARAAAKVEWAERQAAEEAARLAARERAENDSAGGDEPAEIGD